MKEKLFIWLSIIAGCGMLLIAVSPLWENMVNKQNMVQVEATVTKVHWTSGHTNNSSSVRGVGSYAMRWPEVYVSYYFQGIQFSNVRLSDYSYSVYEGQKITIYCDPHDPRIVATARSVQWSSLGWLFLGGLLIRYGVKQILEDKKKSRHVYEEIDELDR
ncbi:MAG: DUF3592 domain-containing protein [Lachnospiraceae bacterium]|nr:DUF3592 domain-containing protein [Lachnospiraceae bacterium]